MKDIYSPLEIDEEWDQRAPVAEGAVATSVNVAGENADHSMQHAVAEAAQEPAPLAEGTPDAGQPISVIGSESAGDTPPVMPEAPAAPEATVSMHANSMVDAEGMPPAVEGDDAEDEGAPGDQPAPGAQIMPQAEPEAGTDMKPDIGSDTDAGDADTKDGAPEMGTGDGTAEADVAEVADEDPAPVVAEQDADVAVSPMDAKHDDGVAGDDSHETDHGTVASVEADTDKGSSVVEKLKSQRQEANDMAKAEIERLDQENKVDNATISDLQAKIKEREDEAAGIHAELEKPMAEAA